MPIRWKDYGYWDLVIKIQSLKSEIIKNQTACVTVTVTTLNEAFETIRLFQFAEASNGLPQDFERSKDFNFKFPGFVIENLLTHVYF